MTNKYFLLLCLFTLSTSIFGQSEYRVDLIPEALKEDANSTTVTETYELEIADHQSIVYKHKRVVTVYNKGGDSDAVAYASYDDDRRISKLSATILDKNGEEIERFRKRDFEDISAVDGGTLYSDSRLMVLQYTPTQYPYTLVFESETQSKDTFYLPTWNLIDYYDSSIWNTRFVVKYNPDLGFRYKVFDPEGVFKINDSEGLLEISASDISATSAEEMGPSPWEFIPNVRVGLTHFSLDGIEGRASNWEELGAWQYRNLVAGLDGLPQDVVSKVSALVADAPNTKEKVRRIYEFMQDNTRYISVQLGIGGLRPYPAAEVIEKGYGDCKGLTNLTMALLNSQGIEANYCVVWAGRDQKSIDADFASLQGNHVILNVPLEDEELWLECTSQTMPFNFLGDFTDNRNVVALTPQGGVIKRTPNYTVGDNTLDTNGTFTLDDSGTISGVVSLFSKGIQYDNRSAMVSKDQKDRISSYKNYWRYVDNLDIVNITLEEDKEEVSLREEVLFSAADFANFSNEKVIVPVNVMDRYTYIPRRYKERTQEAVILRGGVDNTNFSIEIPEGYSVESLPAPRSIESKFGSYTLLVLPDGEGAVQVNRSLVLQRFRATPEEYKELRGFMRSVARSDAAKMVLIKK
ncbi:DUF3857 domain-containing protein [Gilvibacter sediminis]|uniref:DUF3857 domain-containing protein n=1 Tax=Gilvibacter sediminis TaxID=379071 RepID=UPI00234FB884|nr:DUF3857 domain-containing protein [Gilvibacter sediminis]MDC7996926.1 DUF3857 domain-containing protein [Gilvibacter sediminis]